MVLGRKKYDKRVILYVGRKDRIVPYITKARRIKDIRLGLCYEVIDPNKKKIKYKVSDIPTEYFSSSGVIELYTNDFEQFVPSKLVKNKEGEPELRKASNVKVKISPETKLDLHLLTSDQKVWYAKSVKEDIEKTMKKTWWSDNKTLILTILVLAALIIIAYIIMNGIMGAGHLARQFIEQGINNCPIPVNTTGMPPV